MSRHEQTGFVSLKVKMTVAALVSLAVALGVYLFVHFVGNSFMKEMYLSDEMIQKRAFEAFEEFEAYVESNNIASDDNESIMRWCAEKKYLFVSVYDGAKLLFETDGNVVKMGSISSGEYHPYANNYASHRIIHFSDGAYRVNVVEYTEARFSDFVMWIGLACAFVTVFAAFIYFTGRIVGRISQLSRQFEAVADNGKSSSIEVKGNDELSVLASNAEKMRRNIVLHYENEQRAYKSNTELMTAISHDIRTPLTSLLLYTDALSKGKVEKMEDVKKYAQVCYEKSTQLKTLTDTMFRYFLLFTDNGNKPEIGSYDASQILSQLVYEYEFALEQKGYCITVEGLSLSCSVLADPSVLKRVFDNIFSNLEKYADKEKPITVSVAQEEKSVRVSVINYIASDSNNSESNRIGLRSCKKLMIGAGGNFDFGKKGNVFESLIVLPIE